MRTILICGLLIGTAFAQTSAKKDGTQAANAEAPESAALQASRHSFMLVSTRAVALFQSADTVEARLQAQGSTLRPSTTTLRLRIERTLDQAEAAINKGDAAKADQHIKVTGELVNRFARLIGGE